MQEDLAKLHHERSTKDFPELKLVDGEYVVLDVRRSLLGIVFIWALFALGMIVLLVALWALLSTNASVQFLGVGKEATGLLVMVDLVLILTALLVAGVATMVYRANRLIITNRRLFHYKTISLFAKSVNVINLSSIEDASFHQEGIIDQIFQLGTIRMATVGDETTYTFKYIDTPTDELDTIGKLVHEEKEREKELR